MSRPDPARALMSSGRLAPASATGDRTRHLDWDTDGRDWPNRGSSRFIEAGGLRWHVQVAGGGPAMVLLHGTGASTHSWRDVLPLLAREFTVIAPDLPGHGFSGCPQQRVFSLPGMATALSALLDRLGVSPQIAAGHSAGAAIALRMTLDGRIAPSGVVSVNGALLPFRGLAGQLFSPAARLLARLDFVPGIVARRARDPRAVERLLRDTGSVLDERGVTLYRRLVQSPGHVAATITMMSRWDLLPFASALPSLRVPLLLLAGERDGTVSPHDAERVARRVRGASLHRLSGLGHLAHEERPAEVAALIAEFARRVVEQRGD